MHSTAVVPERPEASADADDAPSAMLNGLQLLPAALGVGFVVSTAEAKLVVYSPEINGATDGTNTGILSVSKQLIGNIDEVTDLRLLAVPGEEGIGEDGGGVTHLAVASNTASIYVFSAQNRSCTSSLQGHEDTVLCLDSMNVQASMKGRWWDILSNHRQLDGVVCNALQVPNGPTRVLLASGSKDNTVRLWDCVEARLLATGKGHISAVSAVAFGHSKSRFLVSGGADKLIKVRSLRSNWAPWHPCQVPGGFA